MAALGGGDGGVHSRRACTHDQNLFRPGHRLNAGQPCLAAGTGIGCALERLVRHGIRLAQAAAQTGDDLLLAQLRRFADEKRVGQKLAAHGDQIALAGQDSVFGLVRVVEAAGGGHIDMQHLFDFFAQRQDEAVVIVFRALMRGHHDGHVKLRFDRGAEGGHRLGGVRRAGNAPGDDDPLAHGAAQRAQNGHTRSRTIGGGGIEKAGQKHHPAAHAHGALRGLAQCIHGGFVGPGGQIAAERGHTAVAGDGLHKDHHVLTLAVGLRGGKLLRKRDSGHAAAGQKLAAIDERLHGLASPNGRPGGGVKRESAVFEKHAAYLKGSENMRIFHGKISVFCFKVDFPIYPALL